MKTTKLALLVLAARLLCCVPALAADGAAAQGIELYSAGKITEAKKVLEPWAKAHPKDAEAASYLGRCYWALQDYDQAIDWLEKAVALAPKNAEYQLWLARSTGRAAATSGMLRAMSLGKRCRVAYERAVALDPELIEARSDLVQFYLQAPGIMGGGVDKAQAQAGEIARRDPVRGAVAYANVALHEKDPAKAIKLLDAAIAKAPTEPRLRMALGMVYTSEERWDDAFGVYDAILTTEPNHWAALYQVGRTAALSGKRLDQGKAALERYIAGTPGPDAPPVANAHYRLGMIYQQQGNKNAARAEYQAALRLDPKLKDAKEALEKLG